MNNVSKQSRYKLSISEIKQKTLPIFKQAGVLRSSVFGSVARGEVAKDSDVDILVELPKPYGLFYFLNIKFALEDVLGKKVDLVEYNAIKPKIKDRILKDQINIYEKS